MLRELLDPCGCRRQDRVPIARLAAAQAAIAKTEGSSEANRTA
jgi:hypothetical protein